MTIGQLVARGLEPNDSISRRALLPYGLRLVKLPDESWSQAWLAVANRHPGLDRLFDSYPKYQGGRRAQILKELRRGTDVAKPTEGAVRFAGPQSRALLVPPSLLPSLADERDEAPSQSGPEIPP